MCKDVAKWLDEYELRLAEEQLLEPRVRWLFEAMYQKAYYGKPSDGGWYQFDDDDNG